MGRLHIFRLSHIYVGIYILSVSINSYKYQINKIKGGREEEMENIHSMIELLKHVSSRRHWWFFTTSIFDLSEPSVYIVCNTDCFYLPPSLQMFQQLWRKPCFEFCSECGWYCCNVYHCFKNIFRKYVLQKTYSVDKITLNNVSF